MQEGLRRSVGEPPKLRLNSVLNSVTRRGPFLGNSAGVVAIIYNCINSYLGYLRGKNDAANTIVAGALSGMLFKSTRGIRPMMISGGIVASIAGVWAVCLSTFSFRRRLRCANMYLLGCPEDFPEPRTGASLIWSLRALYLSALCIISFCDPRYATASCTLISRDDTMNTELCVNAALQEGRICTNNASL